MPHPPHAPAPKARALHSGVEPRRAYNLVLIGGWQVSSGEDCVHLVPSAQRLIAFLALNDHVNRAFVAGSLWPDVSEERAQASLRTAIWRVIRRCPGLLVNDKEILGLSEQTAVDLWRLRALNEFLRLHPAEQVSVEAYAQPLAGDLLPGWYEDWVLLERERLRQIRLHVLDAISAGLVAQGRYGEALELALATVSIAPLRESAHREVIRIHLAEGNVAEALRQFEVCARLLKAELGLEPSEQMVDLMGPVLENAPRA